MVSGLVSFAANMPVWGIALLIVLLVILLAGTIFVLWRSRRGAPEKQPKPARAARRRDRDPTGMMRACRQFHGRIRQAFPGGRARYRLPLFAAVGPSRAAIDSVVQQNDLGRPLGDSLQSGGLTWTAFDRAAVVSVDPDIIFGTSDSRDRWRSFSRLLQGFRPQRPLDGIILVLPVATLADAAGSGEDLRRQAETLRERLAELENRLAMTLPIHCVLAECENLDGFSELGELLRPYQLDRPLGYASPYSSKEVYRPEVVDQAVQHISQRLQMLVIEALTAHQNNVDADALFGLPTAISGLHQPLKTYIHSVLEPGQYARLTALRGIYLTGHVNTDAGAHQTADSAFATGVLKERIFPEYSLAEPTGGRWMAANKDVRRAQAAVGIVCVLGAVSLYAQDSILANRVPQVRSLVSAVGKDFRRVAIARSDSNVGTDLFRNDSVQFIQRMSALEGSYLRSLWLPSSWFGQLPRDLNRLQTGAYVEILFKSIGHSLRDRAREVTSETGGTRGRSAEDNGSTPYPRFGPLEAKIETYGRLARQVEHYRALHAGQRDAFALRELTRYLYDIELPDGFFPNVNLDALGARGLALNAIKLDQFDDQAQSSFLEAYGQFTFDLTTRDRVPSRLRIVQDILSERQRLLQPEMGRLGRLRQLYTQLSELNSLFQSGRYDWVTQRDVIIAPKFEALMERVAESQLLGDRVAGRMSQQALRTRRQFLNELTGIGAPDFGAIVVASDTGLSLSRSAHRILQRLEAFGLTARDAQISSQSGFGVQSVDTVRQMPHPVPRGAYVRWRVDALERGMALLQDIAARVEGRSESRSVERALSGVVREEKLDTIVAAIHGAVVEAPARQDMLTSGGSETGLRRRVDSFEAAREYFDTFLVALENLGARELRGELLRLVGWEAEKILVRVDTILRDNQIYAIDRQALAAWPGGPGLAHDVFGVRSQSGLIAYLARQRTRLETLVGDYAQPAMAFLYDHARDYHPERLGEFARLRVLLENLQRYRNKAPGNAIQALENYVLYELPTASVSDCDRIQPDRRVRGDGYIARRLETLANDALSRCITLKRNDIRQRYAALAERFNGDLAGRVPFAAVEDLHTAAPVSPDSLKQFLNDFDRGMNAGLGEPRFWHGSAEAERVINFLDQLDQVVATLRKAMIPEGEQTAIAIEVTPEFRVHRADEIGADHIIGWSFSAGDVTRDLFNANQGVTWNPGTEVSMAFKWAKDAPSEPDDGGAMPGLSIADRTARLSFDNPWSLFTLIARHGVTTAERGAHTLRFVLPVTYKADDGGEARLDGAMARVFVRLRLAANGQSITVPAFPKRAPVITSTGASAGVGSRER